MWPKKPRKIPEVKAVMTPFPYSVESGQSPAAAMRMMDEHGIHHLPVVADGALVGVVSRGDLEGVGRHGRKRSAPKVGDLIAREPYIVSLSERLDRVVLHMAEHGHDAALVVKQGRLAGIFTVTDACRSFGESLRQRFGIPGEDEVA